MLQDLAIIITLAAAAGLICQWLNQPRVIGYIVAGVAIRAASAFFPLLAAESSMHILAELGMIFLMFSMGLDFNLQKLRQAGHKALGVALADVAFMLWLGFMVGHALGWSWVESLFLGAIICDSSTTVLTKVLGDMGRSREPYAVLMLGATVIEDMLAIVLMALLTGVGLTGAVQANLVLGRLGGLLVFLVVLVIGGLLSVPRLINLVGRSRSDELLTITVIGLCFGVALLAIRLQLSLALGAFIIGAIMAESRHRLRIEMLTDPLRDVFGAVFFVAVGLMVDLRMLQANLGTVFLLTAVVILGKFAGSAAGAILVGEDRDTAVKTGCGMAQVNEFALIIAALGVSLKATRDFVYPVAVSVSLLTTFINPYLLRHMDALSGAAERLMPRRLRLGLAVYNRWAVRVQRRRINDAVLRAVRRSVIVIAVNLGWVAAIFLGARFLERTVPRLMAFVPEFLGGARTGFWLAAALLVAPFLVATLRKLKALGMVLAEIKFPPAESAGRTAVARLLTEMAVLGLGGALLGLYILMLGSAILPPWPVLIGLLAALAALTRIFWTLHIRLYARAQHALHEVLSDTQDWFSQHPIGAMPYFFREARLGAVILSGESRVAGRVIRELNLRAETGATIIGIDRGARTIINPDSDETFHSGDRVLLLGTDAQIERARIWMRAEPGGDA